MSDEKQVKTRKNRQATVDKVVARVADFIQRKVVAEDEAGPPITDKDFNEFGRICMDILDAKWDRDMDGYFPINVRCIDKNRFRLRNLFSLPHLHRAEDSEFPDIAEKAVLNVETTAEDLKAVMAEMKHRKLFNAAGIGKT